MKTLLNAELRKLATLRSTWTTLALSVIMSPAIAALALATSTHLHDGLARVGMYAFGPTTVAAGMLCASAFAAEYQDRTILATFTLVPDRGRIVRAKAFAASLVGIAVAVLCLVASYGLAAIWLAGSGVSWPWSAGMLLQSGAGVIALSIATAIAGVGIGGSTQSPAIAGSVMGFVSFGLSNLLATFLPFFRDYGLPAAASALTQPAGHHQYGFAGALAVLVAVCALLFLGGLRHVKTTDIR